MAETEEYKDYNKRLASCRELERILRSFSRGFDPDCRKIFSIPGPQKSRVSRYARRIDAKVLNEHPGGTLTWAKAEFSFLSSGGDILCCVRVWYWLIDGQMLPDTIKGLYWLILTVALWYMHIASSQPSSLYMVVDVGERMPSFTQGVDGSKYGVCGVRNIAINIKWRRLKRMYVKM